MPIGSPQWMYASGEAFTLDQSLRFDDADNSYLTRTPTTAGNRRTWTWSGWVKRGELGSHNTYFGANGTIQFEFHGADWMIIWLSGVGDFLRTNDLFRDTSAWYHIVWAIDTTQATATNRYKLYVNGSQITSFQTYNAPAQNTEHDVSNTVPQYVGTYDSSTAERFDGYIAEVHFVDGQQLTPSSFGETGDYGEWKPIEVSGLTYGTNGFYLPFKQDYTVEGFSATIYNGEAAGANVHGVGFNPDMVWAKCRNKVEGGLIFDSVRGIDRGSYTTSTGDEDSQALILATHKDGLALKSNDGPVNRYSDGGTFVSWCWDMGAYRHEPFLITPYGNVNHSTSQNKVGFGLASDGSANTAIEFDGSGDYIQVNNTGSTFDFGTSGNFTLECWVRPAGLSGGQAIIDIRGNHGDYIELWFSGSNISLAGTNVAISNPASVSNNTWYHFAVVRSGGTVTLYKDGTSVGTDTSTGQIGGTDYSVAFGMYRTNAGSGGESFNGYMDEIRISDSARYTSNFTPQTTYFTDDPNTLLLIHSDAHADNRTEFIDSSGAGAVLNTDGDINSYVKANTTYGQSVVSYTANGSATATVGHGLDSELDMVIVKTRNRARNWHLGHKGIDFNSASNSHHGYMALNTTGNEGTNNGGRANIPNATTFQGESTNGDSMIAYCFHDVTGYSKFGSYTGNGSSSGATQTCGFRPAWIMIKCTSNDGDWRIWDNVRTNTTAGTNANIHLIANLTAVENTTLGLRFLDTGFQCKSADGEINGSSKTYIFAAFADTREYAYWLDQCGNNNDFHPYNLTESDISVDSPTNNFATFNVIDATNSTFSEGNLKFAHSSIPAFARSTMSMKSGKWYYEIIGTTQYGMHGVTTFESGMPTHWLGNDSSGWGYHYDDQVIRNGSSTTYSYGAKYTTGDIIGIALDVDTPSITFYKNGVSQGTFTTNFPANKEWFFASGGDWSGASWVANFGQDSSFAGNKTAQGNQDSNDIGDFYYTPPSGFLALCTSNLPEPAVIPSEHFNTILYTGNGVSGRAMTGVGFQPDMLWTKGRSEAYRHAITDILMGATNTLCSSSLNSISTDDVFDSFDSDGFTLGNDDASNYNTKTYVAWNWKAGGSGVANTVGTRDAVVSANTDAGFSIVTWTGNEGADDSVGHGLSKAPELIIAKSRSDGYSWAIYHHNLGNNKRMQLNSGDAVATDTDVWAETTPTSTVFSIGTDIEVNWDDRTYGAYCFHSVEGYSKFGKWISDENNPDFVYLGFRPKYVVVKSVTTSESWVIFDSARSPYNLMDDFLYCNVNNAETTAHSTVNIDMVSNGFVVRGTNSNMDDGTRDFIYIAFAETPFKYANAR